MCVSRSLLPTSAVTLSQRLNLGHIKQRFIYVVTWLLW